jgi:hypothetical protein
MLRTESHETQRASLAPQALRTNTAAAGNDEYSAKLV